MVINVSPNVRTFTPEYWGQVEMFSHFYAGTHKFNNDTKKALAGVGNHFQKAIILHDLAVKMLPNLDLDHEQLEKHGFTEAMNSKEITAVIEAIFLELYSSIDCTRKVLVSIYKNCRKLPDSTRKLFQRVKKGEIGSDFPSQLKDAIVSFVWYEELLEIRDELTHSDIGSCQLDPNTRLISYSHRGIYSQGNQLVIPGVFGKIDTFIKGLNEFLGSVFNFLNTQLSPYTIDQLCGFFFGRAYMRKMPFAAKIDFNSGVCQSRIWFDTQPEYKCPFSEVCGAYLSAI